MILIVDDKQANLFSLKTLLELHRYTVDTAASGEEALKKVLKHDYALIILDVQMPDMDGYEVAESISSYSKTKDIPILFLSAVNIDKRFITRGFESGGMDYITKPFDPDLLLLKVRSFYRMSEQTRELKLIQTALKEEIEIRKQAQKDLEAMNVSLEDKVDSRTRELKELNQTLEDSNTELAQYAFLASHDLQEPLRKIITFGNLLVDRMDGISKENRVYLDKIISASERMRNLIDDLLNYSKLSVTSHFQKTDLNKIAHNVLSDLEIVIREKNAEIILSKLPVIDAVPGQMRQVFQNIISNALKFSKPGQPCRVSIRCEYTNEKSLTSPPQKSGPFIRLCFEDNGIGFNQSLVDKIFTLFQRLHTKSEYPGTGIGLAIVKKIVEKHGGLLDAKSQEGVGTAFHVLLPIEQTKPEQP
jgi:signal transduction histidine kinase